MGNFVWLFEMTSGGGGSKAQKQEEPDYYSRDQRIYKDHVIEDGVRKELYEKERKAQGNWEHKWGFLRNPRKLWEEEAMKRGLPSNIFDKTNYQRKPPPWPSARQPQVELLPSKGIPQLSSGMIGWRLFSDANNLDRMTGPMYVSRKLTAKPPPGPDEPDLRFQKFIFLG